MRRQRGGFKLGRKLLTFLHRTFRRNRHKPHSYLRLNPNSPPQQNPKPALTQKLLHWTKTLKHLLIHSPTKPKKSYTRLIPYHPSSKPPPKGHLAVYVGKEEGGSPQRFVVPVVYFNHPLFGELLKEAEEQFGFGQPGGITIPCPVARFERVQTRIKEGNGWVL